MSGTAGFTGSVSRNGPGQSGLLRAAVGLRPAGQAFARPRPSTSPKAVPGTRPRSAPTRLAPHCDSTRQSSSRPRNTSNAPCRTGAAPQPIHDPATQAILGILDVTGGDDVGSPQTLGMVRAAARMAEIELARISAVETSLYADLPLRRPRPDGTLRVQALGRPDCAVSAAGRMIRLSPRHSEILVLLMDQPDGLTGEQLEVQLYPTDVHRSTMRAEITRLRTLLGPHVLQSRPYRLLESASGDWQVVGRHLGAGRVAEATASYRGPLLPYSDAPGVVEIREGLHRELRFSLLGSDVPDLMASWTRTRWGADDLPMWARQAQLLPATSPMRTVALAETRRLDRAFGLRAAGLH